MKSYDLIFIGAGASTTLLLMSMKKRNLLNNKSIAIIDPDTKSQNDKTYCFWAKNSDQISIDCNSLVSFRWNKIIVNSHKEELIEPLEYLHITGQEVYNELKKIISEFNIERIYDNAEIQPTKNLNANIFLSNNNKLLESSIVFDSRTPKFNISSNNQFQLSQSFIGYIIEAEENIPSFDCVRLMDFEIEQQGYTQFIYILPFEKNKALVELTRFGSERINNYDVEAILPKYIKNKFGNFKILTIEEGCIPMSNADIIKEEYPNLFPIGARAGAIKASTGYAFKKMHEHAEQIAESLYSNNQSLELKTNRKFKFYDSLLLQILNYQPEKGKKIFETLFEKNKANKVLNFIDEKTNLIQDVKILTSLPIMPFLNALFFHTKNRLKKLNYSLTLLAFTLFMCLLNWSSNQVFTIIELVFFSIGLVIVGIPHGAVDNIVDSLNMNIKINIKFIIKYLSISIIYFSIWLISPNIALALFLAYSAWHFGQADMFEWTKNNNQIVANLFWGITLLGIILLGHLKETNNILENLNTFTFNLNENSADIITFSLYMVSALYAVYHKKSAMLISATTLYISTTLPLISSFGIYFIGQHSITGWTHLRAALKTDNISLFKKSIPFNFAAISLLIAMYFGINNTLISTFFILISCISLPHVLVMNSFYQNNNKTINHKITK